MSQMLSRFVDTLVILVGLVNTHGDDSMVVELKSLDCPIWLFCATGKMLTKDRIPILLRETHNNIAS
jgi:hypothetical protein